MNLPQFRNELKNWLTHPPYRGVVWLCWLYVVAACLIAGGGPFTGNLAWFDDRVRLVQILNWLNGADWYDRTIMRVNAPEGFHTIWSRIVDLPIAAVIALFQNTIGQMPAAMLAATLVPLLQVLLLFFATSYAARPLIGKRNKYLITLFVLFTSSINAETFTLAGFQLGAVSHHGWYVLATLMLFGAFGRLLLAPHRHHIMTAALAIATLLAIGIEGLPLIAGACTFIALIACLYNRPPLSQSAFLVTSLGAVGGLALLPANLPHEKWLTISYAEPSLLGPLLTIAVAIFFALQTLILKTTGGKKTISLFLTTLLGLTSIGILLYLFPPLLTGGTASLSPEERQLALREHTEVMTLWKVARGKIDYLRLIMPSLLAVAFALYTIKNARQRQQPITIYYLGLTLLTFALASLYARYYHYASLMACPWLLLAWQATTRNTQPGNAKHLITITTFIAIGPLWFLLLPAANNDARFGSDVLLFPAKLQTAPQRCDTRMIAERLNVLYGPDKTIIVPMYMSDRFLLYTKLKIFFLANFPSQNKFIEAKKFFETTSPETAREIVAAHNIDLVAVCPQAYRLPGQHRGRSDTIFALQLGNGLIPDWLKSVEITPPAPWLAPEPWLLFEVKKSSTDNKP